MAIIIEAPNEIYSPTVRNSIKLFLAGGIQHCPNWQSYVIGELSDIPNLTIYNPRRKEMKMGGATLEQQITWEFEHLAAANVVLFWFSSGSLNPISLYELGMWGNSMDRPMIVGCDPNYERKEDVRIQTNLAKPEAIIYDSLEDMILELTTVFENLKNVREDDQD